MQFSVYESSVFLCDIYRLICVILRVSRDGRLKIYSFLYKILKNRCYHNIRKLKEGIIVEYTLYQTSAKCKSKSAMKDNLIMKKNQVSKNNQKMDTVDNDFVIETKQLIKTYGEQMAVNAVDLHVKKGRIYGLLGRNGAGKTTIMKMILGLTPITSGEVDVFGRNIKGREKQVYPRIGAIIETPGFYPNLTGTENLEIFAKLRGTSTPNAVENALKIVGLPYKDKKLFSKYSLGMKQRLGIANAILHDPELLILDEPTNGLDPIGIAEVREFIKNFESGWYKSDRNGLGGGI